jgi:small-conductance mechanosensitive channel
MNEISNQMNVVIFKAGNAVMTLGGLVAAALVLTLGYWIARKTRILIQKVLAPRFNIDRSTGFALGTMAFYVIVVLTTLCALDLLGFDISNLAIVAGALSVGIGLGLQSIANNFVSGLLLLFDRSIKVGDYIELSEGYRGSIEQIRVRSTIIRTNDDIEVIVPNSHFLSEPVINWTLSEASRRMHIPFGVGYGSDVDKLFDIIVELAHKLPDVKLDDPERMPRLWFTEMGESSLNFELILWVKPPATMRPRGTTSVMLRAIHKALQDHDFEIPFPQRDVHIRTMPDTMRTPVSS